MAAARASGRAPERRRGCRGGLRGRRRGRPGGPRGRRLWLRGRPGEGSAAVGEGAGGGGVGANSEEPSGRQHACELGGALGAAMDVSGGRPRGGGGANVNGSGWLGFRKFLCTNMWVPQYCEKERPQFFRAAATGQRKPVSREQPSGIIVELLTVFIFPVGF